MFVKMDKPDFIGKQALLDKGTPAVTRIGLEMMDRGIAREDCPVYAGGDLVGRTTSGTHCPFMQKALAMALVDRQHAVPGTELTVEVRGRRLKAKVVPLPFYKRSAQ
jgi:aminomethyltransferase